MAHERAGTPATEADLIDVDAVLAAYHDAPDPNDPDQQVVFGTSGHRGSSLDRSFNDLHIAATTQAIVEHRAAEGIDGPLFIGTDPHALSAPAWRTAVEVLVANGVEVHTEPEGEFTPTPALSRAIIRHNRDHHSTADGIVVTPSHNPPRDGGFKYNPPHGGPAGSEATTAIAARANALMADPSGIKRIGRIAAGMESALHRVDLCGQYCAELGTVLDLEAIAGAKVRIGADPMGGASVGYWAHIAEHLGLDLTVVNPRVDPRWSFMTLDTDGKIRMDCSSPDAMASLIGARNSYDISTGNDADADRHGIVTPDGGLLNPNHFLAVSIQYLFAHRPGWAEGIGVGKTLVSSAMTDRVAEAGGLNLIEVPVGFKWFVPGLSTGELGFGGEESAGASFLARDGSTWTTDKDGIVMALLAAEILAVTGRSPSQLYAELAETHGAPVYKRIDAPAGREQKARLAALDTADITADTLAGDQITQVLTRAPGNDAPIGGIKVLTDRAWFAARPSGTEDVYKIYAESFVDADHLDEVLAQAQQVVDAAL